MRRLRWSTSISPHSFISGVSAEGWERVFTPEILWLGAPPVWLRCVHFPSSITPLQAPGLAGTVFYVHGELGGLVGVCPGALSRGLDASYSL